MGLSRDAALAYRLRTAMFNWDDMRVFIAVVQAGSFSGAGRRIGMDATTVARRIQRLESCLKATLVVRGRTGFQLTAAGVRLAEAGASVEAAMSAAGEKGAVNALAGTVRLSVAEGFGAHVLAPALPAFLDRHPGLQIEIDASPGYLSPTTRKVDISITSSAPESSRLVVEPLTDYQLGLYASRHYLQKHGTPRSPDDLRHHEFVGCVDDLIYSDKLNFLEAFAADLPRHLKCTSIKVQIVLVQSGGGIAALPHYLVEDFKELTPVLPDLVVTRTYWMATHSELYEISRVRALHDWIHSVVSEHRLHLAPRPAQSAALSVVR